VSKKRLAGLTVAGLGMLMLTSPWASSPLSGQDPARAAVERWVEAVGGMDTYHAMRGAQFTLTTEMWDTTSGRLRRTRPRYVTIARDTQGLYSRIERWEGDNFIAQGWHPTGQWATLNGDSLGPGDKDYDESDYVGGDVNYWIGLPFKLLDPGVNLDSEGTDELGRHVVRVTFGTNVGDHQDTWRYYFVDGQSWPVLVQYTEDGSTNVNHTRWEDLGVIDGYPYVGRRVHVDDQGRVWKVIRTSDVTINPDFDPGVFRTP